MHNPHFNLKQFPKIDLYRFLVDGRFHSLISSTLNPLPTQYGWVGYENREPGSLQAFFKALAFLFRELNSPLSTPFIQRLHLYATQSVRGLNPDTKPGEFRTMAAGFNLNKYNITETGLKALQVFTQQHFGELINRQTNHSITGLINYADIAEYRYMAPLFTRQQFTASLDQALSDYEQAMKQSLDSDRKFEVMIELIYFCVHLHPFKDGNTRTFVNLLLMKLLLAKGFLPPIFYNPNCFDGFASNELLQELKIAIKNTAKLLNDEKILFDFDSNDIPGKEMLRYAEMLNELKDFFNVD